MSTIDTIVMNKPKNHSAMIPESEVDSAWSRYTKNAFGVDYAYTVISLLGIVMLLLIAIFASAAAEAEKYRDKLERIVRQGLDPKGAKKKSSQK